MAEAYLIQGFFFQQRQGLGVAMRPGEGAVAVVRRALYRDMFAGMFYRDPESVMEGLSGEMTDRFGRSQIHHAQITDSLFSFTKHYASGGHAIYYRFSREGAIWVGNFSGEAAGRGQATCVTTLVSEELLQPPRVP